MGTIAEDISREFGARIKGIDAAIARVNALEVETAGAAELEAALPDVQTAIDERQSYRKVVDYIKALAERAPALLAKL